MCVALRSIIFIVCRMIRLGQKHFTVWVFLSSVPKPLEYLCWPQAAVLQFLNKLNKSNRKSCQRYTVVIKSWFAWLYILHHNFFSKKKNYYSRPVLLSGAVRSVQVETDDIIKRLIFARDWIVSWNCSRDCKLGNCESEMKVVRIGRLGSTGLFARWNDGLKAVWTSLRSLGGARLSDS